MKKKDYDELIRNCKFLFIFFIIASCFLLSSCSDTVTPTGTTQRVVTVNNYLNDATTGQQTNQPALGTDVQLFDTKNNLKSGLILEQDAANGTTKLTFQAPVVGHQYILEALYNSQLNSTSLYPCCKDTTVNFWFNQIPPPALKCDSLGNMNDSIIFKGTNNSDTITQGTNEISQCRTIFTNIGAVNVRITLPTFPAPFRLISTNPQPTQTGGNTIDLPPNQSLTVCVGFNTAASVGTYNSNVRFTLSCQTFNGTFDLSLKAILSAPQCKCPVVKYIPVTKTDRIPIGTTQNYSDIVFVNDLACCINGITVSDLNNLGEWSVVNDYSNKTINVGENLVLTSNFKPKYVLSRPDTFLVTFNLCSGGQCRFYVIYAGQGCFLACPVIDIDGVKTVFDGSQKNIITSNARDQRTSYSRDVSCITDRSIAFKTLPISISDSACDNQLTISVSVSDTEQSQVSKDFFRVSPSSFTLQPGTTQNLSVQFIAPTIKQYEDIFIAGKRVKTGTSADSTFTIFITISSSSSNCRIQRLKVTAIVTTVPKISPVRNLRAYRQLTDLKPTAENEIYCFDCLSNDVFTDLVTSLRNPNGTPGPYPPNQGDIYVDVTDPTPVSPVVNKEPFIFVIQSGLFNCIKIWKNMSESTFDDTQNTVKTLQTEYTGGTFDFNVGCAPSVGSDNVPVNQIRPGQVYVVWSNSRDAATGLPCNIGLIYIRQINFGTEANTNHQTAVEFRTIFPVMF